MKGVRLRPLDPERHVPAEPLEHRLHQQPLAQQVARLDHEVLALAQLVRLHLLRVDVLEREHAEGHVARLVGHDARGDVLDQRLARHLEPQQAERRQRETLDQDLHAEEGEVPARVAQDVVEQRLEARVHAVREAELLGQVAVVDLDVARLVEHLARGVELGLGPRHRLDDLRRREQRALLAVQELREHEAVHVDLERRCSRPGESGRGGFSSWFIIRACCRRGARASRAPCRRRSTSRARSRSS